MEDSQILVSTTSKFREYGFQVEMDDFGSGYSSLNMLKEVPVDRIKLDLRFLTGAGDANMGRIIVTHMVQMMQDLGISLIAEGVETEGEAEYMANAHVDYMQGFFFGVPF